MLTLMWPRRSVEDNMSMLPEYPSFQAYAEDGDYVLKDIADSDENSKFLCVVFFYRVCARSLTTDYR
jgi:hypothetical protein